MPRRSSRLNPVNPLPPQIPVQDDNDVQDDEHMVVQEDSHEPIDIQDAPRRELPPLPQSDAPPPPPLSDENTAARQRNRGFALPVAGGMFYMDRKDIHRNVEWECNLSRDLQWPMMQDVQQRETKHWK